MKQRTKQIAIWFWRLTLLLLALVGIAMVGCSLPPPNGRTVSQALSPQDSAATTLGKALAAEQQQHSNLSGVYLLGDAREAFAARVKLAMQAEKTLDVQYYIWHGDTTGTLLLEALHDAAERGVRVRLLIDDHGTSGLDGALAAMDAHPNIEVRLFNPFVFRPFKLFGFVTDFTRANRRMHNKSFTADNAATILGGRNVGDEYFGATDGVLFADLDALAVGAVVPEVSLSFDAYWSSASAYPVSTVIPPASAAILQAAQEHSSVVEHSSAAATYKQAIMDMAFVSKLVQRSLPMEWAPTQFIVDAPSKGLAQAKNSELLLHHIGETIGKPQQSLDLVSPYFVPTDAGSDYFVNLAKQGVRVRILTNSMAATDVLAVHSGYARYRQRLIEGGVLLYEMKPNANNMQNDGVGFMGSSGSSLHAKTFGADDKRMFVGSFNFDPRSAKLNTELGMVVHSAKFGQQMDDAFANAIPQRSWQVVEDGNGDIVWLDHAQQPPQQLTTEPMSSWWQRASVAVLSLLPIEWML